MTSQREEVMNSRTRLKYIFTSCDDDTVKAQRIKFHKQIAHIIAQLV